jgi:acetyl esterase
MMSEPRFVHPQVRRADAVQPRVPLTPSTPSTLEASRQSMRDATLAECGAGLAVFDVVDLVCDGVRCRLYRADETAGGTVVFLHGGGWVLGDLDTHDALCRGLCRQAGRPVLAVDYRLAPEHPYPAALEDTERALEWLRRDGRSVGLSADPVVIVGDSAGGHLATVVARRCRDRGADLAGQILVYPVIDPAANYPAEEDHGLGADEMRFFWRAYAPADADLTHADLAPLRADLAGLPPTLIITADLDPLRVEGERYAEALANSGVPVTAVRYLGLNHGFARKLAIFDGAGMAVSQIGAAIRHLLQPMRRE